MELMKYKIIKSEDQYAKYCKALEDLLRRTAKTQEVEDEIELLTYLIEKWDSENSTFNNVDPIEMLHYLMKDKKMKAKDLVNLLGVSKGLVSDILNYKKGLSKGVIRILANEFKVNHEAFNRPYKLKITAHSKIGDTSLLNSIR
jgi:HTH-type transcriptional regulator / antitoxin HigA